MIYIVFRKVRFSRIKAFCQKIDLPDQKSETNDLTLQKNQSKIVRVIVIVRLITIHYANK